MNHNQMRHLQRHSLLYKCAVDRRRTWLSLSRLCSARCLVYRLNNRFDAKKMLHACR